MFWSVRVGRINHILDCSPCCWTKAYKRSLSHYWISLYPNGHDRINISIGKTLTIFTYVFLDFTNCYRTSSLSSKYPNGHDRINVSIGKRSITSIHGELYTLEFFLDSTTMTHNSNCNCILLKHKITTEGLWHTAGSSFLRPGNFSDLLPRTRQPGKTWQFFS